MELMMLKKGKIYFGQIEKKYVLYLGKIKPDWGEEPLHEFEYVVPKDLPGPKGGISGYGQTDEQMLAENYELAPTAEVLYGKV